MVQSLFKTGVVAHIVGMPANTLRVWERRYGLHCQQQDEHGHRLYTPDDVQRIAALRQLTQQGHAIGVVAGLNQAELRELLATQSQVREAARQTGSAPSAPARRLQVVGAALATRVRRCATPAELRIVATRDRWPAPAEELTAPDEPGDRIALLVHLPSLHAAQAESLAAAAAAQRVPALLVVYSYSNSSTLQRCAELGIQTWRDTHNDRALVGWLLESLAPEPTAPLPAPALGGPLPPPQFDEATLQDWAARRSDIRCECPSHVAELLLRVQQFEAYSADCEHRDNADRLLHEQLHRLAGNARRVFEEALQLVARHEQL